MPDKPETALLFSAALEAARRAYGRRGSPRRITIITQTGLEVSFDVPPDWEPDPDLPSIRCSPDCFAEVLATIVQAGRRMTRAVLLEKMARMDRKRAESTVCVAPEDLQALGIIDNRQDTSPKGYFLAGN